MSQFTENIEPSVINLFNAPQARHYRVIPFKINDEYIFLYTDKTENINELCHELNILLDKKINFQTISSSQADQLLNRFYPLKNDSRQQLSFYQGESDNFLAFLIKEAKALGSSDIHIETYEEICRVRIRIDGALILRYLLDKKQYPTLINKIKITANLDITEKRLPQDGRILFQREEQKIDIRVSLLPTLYGEKVVLRLLNNDTSSIHLSELGFSDTDLMHFIEGVRKPNGILLISGPTGSGKTTTLYATLKELNKEWRNIITIEDPIEYTLMGINQVQLKENIGLSFAAALKTFLRQDPDIIMLGEIRDAETANMAIRAALTGHLVLSTIHTNSAWGIVSRLLDMGIEPFLLANTLNTAVAQRLVKLLCPNCKKEEVFVKALYPKSFIPPAILEHHYVAVGCEKCFYTGYKGRLAVYEVIPIDEHLSEQIKKSNFKINNILKNNNIKTLSDNAFQLLISGQTSMDEVYPLLLN